MSSPTQTLTAAPSATPAPSAASVQSARAHWAPTAKVSVGLLAASVTALLLPFLKKMTGSDLSASDGAAITTVMTFLIQYLVPERGNTTQN